MRGRNFPRSLTLPAFIYSIFSFGPSQIGVIAPQLPQRTARLEQLVGCQVLDCEITGLHLIQIQRLQESNSTWRCSAFFSESSWVKPSALEAQRIGGPLLNTKHVLSCVLAPCSKLSISVVGSVNPESADHYEGRFHKL